MSTKKINAGDTLTVGDLTDDHLGAVIEVRMSDEVTTRLRLGRVTPRGRSTDVGTQKTIWACDEYPVRTWLSSPVKVITPA